MKEIKVMKKYLNPYKYIHRLLPKRLKDRLSDEAYLKIEFPAHTGYRLDLEHPQTYNEKLNWLKLHDRKAIYPTMVDKLLAKDFVAGIIGEKYIIPTIGVWEKFEDINFDALPDQFVLKCTHDSGGVVICKDKNTFDKKAAGEKIKRSLNRRFFYVCREWPYKDLKPRIIAEKYMVNDSDAQNDSPLVDYKIYTFNGVAKVAMINTDRGIDTRADYYDRDYNWLDFKWGYEHAAIPPQKPKNYEKMFELAEHLAVGTVALRVDFYESNGELYFGELTFYDGGGFDAIEPIEWDIKLGSWVHLPE